MPDWLVGTSVVSPWGPLCQEAYGKSRDLQMRSRRGGGGGGDCRLWGQKTGCSLPNRNLSMSVYGSMIPAGHT